VLESVKCLIKKISVVSENFQYKFFLPILFDTLLNNRCKDMKCVWGRYPGANTNHYRIYLSQRVSNDQQEFPNKLLGSCYFQKAK
jgi:hypothetical protein